MPVLGQLLQGPFGRRTGGGSFRVVLGDGQEVKRSGWDRQARRTTKKGGGFRVGGVLRPPGKSVLIVASVGQPAEDGTLFDG
jgi:hypothetical protein